MTNNNTQRKDWRDSKITKVLAYALTGALVFGEVKLYQSLSGRAEREFEAEYGYLRNQPEAYQLQMVTSNVNRQMGRWNSNGETRDWIIRTYMDKLRK